MMFFTRLSIWPHILVVHFFSLWDKFYFIDIKYFVYSLNIGGDFNHLCFLFVRNLQLVMYEVFTKCEVFTKYMAMYMVL